MSARLCIPLTERPPGAVAVRCDGRSPVTYSELDARRARLAERLLARGVGPETVVAVSLTARADTVVALLAVLSVGGVYLPLDTTASAEWRREVLTDSGAQVELRDGPHAGAEPVLEGRADPPTAGTDPTDANTAYVLYTSGTTGRPKGVCVSRAALAAHLDDMAERLEMEPDDRVLWFAAPHVDVALEQALTTLFAGATVVTRGPGLLSFGELAELIDRHAVTVANLPAGYWNAFALSMSDRQSAACRGLRLMISGSERMSAAAVANWQRLLPDVPLLNAYGPTESVITSTLFRVPPGMTTREEIPIGTACGGRRLHVLDERLDPVPGGRVGELYIGGVPLARGYLARPATTAERFVPDPYADSPGALMYRTGDLVRETEGGSLVFVGRADDQVKIRGFRVEPAEVRLVLERHPAVRHCAVLGRSTPRGHTSLVAYTVAPDTTAAELVAHASHLLPPHMVPTVVLLPALPLTTDGKLDRAALPEPGESGPDAAGTAPEVELSATEAALAGIWCRMLDIPRVGKDANFFALGGDSLAALQLAAELLAEYGPGLSAQAVFSAGTLAELAAVLDDITADTAAESAAEPPGPGQDGAHHTASGEPRDDGLSAGQRSLWFLERWAPGTATYNVPWEFRLSGPVDHAALEGALRTVVSRHDVLRSVFIENLGRPQRVIRPDLAPGLRLVEPSAAALPAPAGSDSRDPAGQEESVRACLHAAARAPFDLEHGPLLRAVLVRTGEEQAVLLVVFHHLVWDELSLPVFERELAEAYTAAVEQRDPVLPQLTATYDGFVAWQARSAAGATHRAGLDHWARRLADAPALLRLPTDRPRPEQPSYDGATVGFALPATVGSRVRALARQENATPFLVLLTSCAATLLRYSGQEDMVLGTPVSGRSKPEFEGLIGNFVNLLPLRVDLSGEPTFRELLRRVRTAVLADFGHQDVPFEAVVDRVLGQRPTSHAPLVQAVFEMHRHAGDGWRAGPLTARRALVPTGTAKFDVGWQVTDDGRSLHGVVEYNTGLFDEETVRELVEGWKALLSDAVNDPDTATRTWGWGAPRTPSEAVPKGTAMDAPSSEHRSSAPTLIGGARKSTAHRSGDAPPDIEETLYDLIRSRPDGDPERPAVSVDGVHLGHAELTASANRLARRLRALGVGPGVVVGVLAERGLDLVVALLAVVASGGAYLPLDPDHPSERLEHMVSDVAAPVVLAQHRFVPLLPAGKAAVLDLDDPGQWAEESDRPLAPLAGPADPAYVIFTSGSTGRPKAVSTSHRSIHNRLAWMQRQYPLGADDVVLQKTPFGFDVSVWEFFWPLMTGARLVLARPGGHRDPGYLRELIVAEQVTTVHFVPSMLRVFLAQEGVEKCLSLRRTMCSGEELPPRLVNDFLSRMPGELHNLYGPTEAAVDVSAWRCRPLPRTARTTPIGRPISGVRLYVLDPAGEPVPAGVRGELHIGGVAVAIGYLNQPRLTADRFVPDPFSDDGSRLYRTGDAALRREDGELEYLGRLDDQMKIRGQRAEPGEIETMLEGHPAVSAAVAVLVPDGEDHRLQAYVVVAAGCEVDAAELRARAGSMLPDHMVPTHFRRLSEVPLTGNGKVARSALRAGDAGDPLPSGTPPPGTDGSEGGEPVEQVLNRIWSMVLALPGLHRDQDLFTSGAHSLNTLRVRARIAVALHTDVPLRTMFKSRTVAQLARSVRANAGSLDEMDRRASAVASLPPLGDAEWVRAVTELDSEVR
ncbi:amino acid adenylation domain-containing protein [Streptomyces sp. NBC_01433]|uniref:non-ribosomal peptide synthetase n=1 Tax=Streptomyces sp. NBC_01433 TaxID=2903864 RepID=UPI00224E0F80|nr:non-ribosomal peptide synthetase [Streptomyces sp. NBC_01433]MCX4679075.1 amino acid adenylation domain-containing protein [Streptomyces sp. NBC_01433]